uniref:Uncharacterized protein n=1 Tax=Heterorhabditis bacteriophora TaxID=37862 RepID=A0A1I7WYM9_HETBA
MNKKKGERGGTTVRKNSQLTDPGIYSYGKADGFASVGKILIQSKIAITLYLDERSDNFNLPSGGLRPFHGHSFHFKPALSITPPFAILSFHFK